MIINYKEFNTSMRKLGSLVRILGLVDKGLAEQINNIVGKGEYNTIVHYLERENKVKFLNRWTRERLNTEGMNDMNVFVLQIPSKKLDHEYDTKSMCKSIW